MPNESIRAVLEAMWRDGSWGRYHGPHCDALQSALAEFHQVEHVILCSSGTCAVELALRGAKVGVGDEVVLAAYDYRSNFSNVLAVGAIPVLVDTLPGLPVVDVDQVVAAFSPKTRAVVCSHLHGCLAPIRHLKELAEKRGIAVIEDACQSPGGHINGRPVASLGDVGILSFGGSKLLTAGRGGAILTNDAAIAQRIRLYVQRGNDAYPLSEMQAAVLLPQLHDLPRQTRLRLAHVRQLLTLLPADCQVQPALLPCAQTEQDVPSFYKVAFRHRTHNLDTVRDRFCDRIRKQGVALSPAFTGLHLTHSRRRFRAVGSLDHATKLHHTLMTLHHPVLLFSDLIPHVARVLADTTLQVEPE